MNEKTTEEAFMKGSWQDQHQHQMGPSGAPASPGPSGPPLSTLAMREKQIRMKTEIRLNWLAGVILFLFAAGVILGSATNDYPGKFAGGVLAATAVFAIAFAVKWAIWRLIRASKTEEEIKPVDQKAKAIRNS